MNKTMSDCCAFWALYICLNENGQYEKEEEAQNWLDWMEELAEKEDESQLERNFCPRCGKRTNDIHTCTPPQRTWVGLTDEEKDHLIGLHIRVAQCAVDAWIEGLDDFIQAIEAKLKEKNT